MGRFVLCLVFLWISVVGVQAQEIHKLEYAGKHYTVCKVDLTKQKLRLFWRDDAGVPFKSFDRLNEWLKGKGERLTFAMNGGMYHGDLSPVGLYVENGKELRPLNVLSGEGNFFLKPNGAFVITEAGAFVQESSKVPALGKLLLATQSGPMLVMDGRLHPAFHPDSQSRLFRNGVGVISRKQVVFVISEEPVNFTEFALLFRDKLGCRDALFLDGTVSSLYSRALGRDDKRIDLGTFIGITEPF